jgi:hypothetical protein
MLHAAQSIMQCATAAAHSRKLNNKPPQQAA